MDIPQQTTLITETLVQETWYAPPVVACQFE